MLFAFFTAYIISFIGAISPVLFFFVPFLLFFIPCLVFGLVKCVSRTYTDSTEYLSPAFDGTFSLLFVGYNVVSWLRILWLPWARQLS